MRCCLAAQHHSGPMSRKFAHQTEIAVEFLEDLITEAPLFIQQRSRHLLDGPHRQDRLHIGIDEVVEPKTQSLELALAERNQPSVVLASEFELVSRRPLLARDLSDEINRRRELAAPTAIVREDTTLSGAR